MNAMSCLSVRDLLSVVRVCSHLRTTVCKVPSLWTQEDRIQEPSALRFVLESAKTRPISIANLPVDDENDHRLQLVADHMWHVRNLGLYLTTTLGNITDGTHAYTLFTTPAPLLQRLSFGSHYTTPNATLPVVSLSSSAIDGLPPLFAGIAPLLNALYARRVVIAPPFLRHLSDLQSLQTYSFGLKSSFAISTRQIFDIASNVLPYLRTFNLELAVRSSSVSTPTFPPSLRCINFRWTSSGPLVPSDVFPNHAAWKIVPIVRITHVGDTPQSSSDATYSGTSITIPETDAPYCTIHVHTSNKSTPRVHVRAVDVEDRERIFCGLHPMTVGGVVSRIQADRLSAITLTTTAVAFNVLSDTRCPVLRRVRLVSSTRETNWVSTFARDILSVTTLECIELSVEPSTNTFGWTTATVLRVLACCMAAGSILEQVVFLGFEPEARCVSQAATFAVQVIVNRNWKEPSGERIWFTEPSFDWI